MDFKDTEINIGDKVYTISPQPKFGMIDEVKKHLRSKNIALAGEILKAWPDCDDRKKRIDALTSNIKDEDVTDYLNSKDGQIFYIWLCLKPNHPEMTLEKFMGAPLVMEGTATVVDLLSVKKKKPGRPAKETAD